jgi:hypothetical protein
VSRWTGLPPVPYPDDTGVKARQLDDPVQRPEPREPDENWDRLCKGLPGLRRPADLPDEDRVRWTPWP